MWPEILAVMGSSLPRVWLNVGSAAHLGYILGSVLSKMAELRKVAENGSKLNCGESTGTVIYQGK